MASALRGRDSTSTPIGDRDVKRKRCALDFDHLKCPICLEPLFPPVYQCQIGHTACAGCCKKLTKGSCPLCSRPIGANRCIVIEKIIESLQVNCKYAAWGCKEMLQYTKNKRDKHEDVCEFRPYHCPVVGCNHQGPKLGHLQHFLSDHNGSVQEVLLPDDERRSFITLRTDYGTYDKSFSRYVLLEVLGHEDDSENESLFLMHHLFHEKFCRYSFSWTSFGASNTLTRYRLSVNFESGRGFNENYSIEGPIRDNQRDNALLTKVVRQGDCLFVPKLHPGQKDSPQFDMELWLL